MMVFKTSKIALNVRKQTEVAVNATKNKYFVVFAIFISKNEVFSMEKRWYQRLAPLSLILALMILFMQPFTVVSAAENTYVIKAGTYRFNDVLSFPTWLEDGYYFHQPIQFTIRDVISIGQEQSDLLEENGFYLPVGDYIVNFEADDIFFASLEDDFRIFYSVTINFDDVAYNESLHFLVGYDGDAIAYNVMDGWMCSGFSNFQTITILEDTEVTSEYYEWFTANAVCLDLQEGGKTDMGIVESITSVWTAVATWFISTMGLVPSLFYVEETGLTFIGTLAIFGGGLTVIIGIIYAVRSWLKSR